MRTLYTALFLFCGLALGAQKVDFSPSMQIGLADIAHLRYADLKEKITREKIMNKGNRVPDYLEAAALCIELFVNENEATYLKKEPILDGLKSRLEELPDSEPFKRVFLGEIYLAQASLQGKFQNNIQAAWLFYKAYSLLKENYELYPNFEPTYVPWGVLNAAIGSLPANYRNIAGFLGFEGNITLGLNLVRKGYYACLASKQYQFYQPYFGFVYCYINYQLGSADNVDLYKLGLSVEESAFFIYLQSKILLKKGETQKAYALLKRRPQGNAYLNFNYLNYATGKVALTLEDPKAVFYLKQFLKDAHNHNYFKSTYRFLAWHYLLSQKPDSLALYRSKILTAGATFVGADKQAVAEAQRGFNATLIKARLRFDGGYYPEVIKMLNDNAQQRCCSKPWELTEFFYRKGRAFQELGLQDKAIASYQQALNIKNTPPTSALGNSALQLALILEDRRQFEQSKKYYQKTLQINDFPFYEGIHQKAKTGLTRLK
jgi:hypothetical protein